MVINKNNRNNNNDNNNNKNNNNNNSSDDCYNNSKLFDKKLNSPTNRNSTASDDVKKFLIRCTGALSRYVTGFNKKEYIKDTSKRVLSYKKLGNIINTLFTIQKALQGFLVLSIAENEIRNANNVNKNSGTLHTDNKNQKLESLKLINKVTTPTSSLTKSEIKELLSSASSVVRTSLFLVDALEKCTKFFHDNGVTASANHILKESFSSTETNILISLISKGIDYSCSMISLIKNNSEIISQEIFNRGKQIFQLSSITALRLSAIINFSRASTRNNEVRTTDDALDNNSFISLFVSDDVGVVTLSINLKDSKF